jgi:tRNA-dihydrouridine synthase B
MAIFPELKNPFILAPMAGITDDPFRRLCMEQGAALVYSEMVSAKALHYNDAKSLELLRHTPGAGSVAYQLFGFEPDVMAEAVERLDAQAAGKHHSGQRAEGECAVESADENVGACAAESAHEKVGACAVGSAHEKILSCVSYDVNMGCPVPKVVRNGEGSALMRDSDRAARIVEAMARATGKPVTVKTRAGWDTSSVNAVSFACAMEQAGAAAIAVHGRTREQYYSGTADWEIIARVKEAVGIPVIGSGDVMSGEDAVRMLRETGCDYVMIARGALGNPWIFREALELTYADSCAHHGSTAPEQTADSRTYPERLLSKGGHHVTANSHLPSFRIKSGMTNNTLNSNPERATFEQAQKGIPTQQRHAFSQATVGERAEMFARHARMLEADKGAYIAVREMRKHAGWYFKGLPGVAALRAKVNTITSMDELTDTVSFLTKSC